MIKVLEWSYQCSVILDLLCLMFLSERLPSHMWSCDTAQSDIEPSRCTPEFTPHHNTGKNNLVKHQMTSRGRELGPNINMVVSEI